MKTKILAVLLCIFMLSALPLTVLAEDKALEKPEITSGSMVVVRSADTGQLLLDTTDGRPVSPTVSAKLVTAMVAFDMLGKSSFGKTVLVPSEATIKANVGTLGDISCPMLGLKAKNKMTVEKLFCATLISAANDACFTLAYYASDGDIDLFVDKMNEKVESFGCTNTFYSNCVGLTDGVSKTTARDVAIIATQFYSYANGELLKISSKPTYTADGSDRPIHTKNYLLSKSLISTCYLEGVKGMIAGQARADGGYCLITSAEKNGLVYIFVVMEAPGEVREEATGKRSFTENNAYNDVKKIFPWATTAFGYLSLAEKGEFVETSIEVTLGKDDYVNAVTLESVDLLLPVNIKKEDIKRRIVIDEGCESFDAPVEKNKLIGSLELYYGDEMLASVPLITAKAIPRDDMRAMFDGFGKFLRSSTMKNAIHIILVILICYVIFVVACKVYSVIIKANAIAQKKAVKQRRIEQEKNNSKTNNE